MKIVLETYHISYKLDGRIISLKLTKDNNIRAHFHDSLGIKPELIIDVGDRLKAISMMSGAMESSIKSIAYDLEKLENDDE